MPISLQYRILLCLVRRNPTRLDILWPGLLLVLSTQGKSISLRVTLAARGEGASGARNN